MSRNRTPRPSTQTNTRPIVTSSTRARPPRAARRAATKMVAANSPTRRSIPALAAAAAGIDLRVGLFAATIFVAALLAALGGRARVDDVTIGLVFVWVLGLGVLFLDIFSRGSHGGNGIIASRTL